jgi:sarcosine oxidase
VSGTADVIVVGLGAMGSATASALARRGVRVLGLDAFRPPHDRGSSHGESRVIRQAYFEHPLYVPLVRAAYRSWRELEERTGRRLLRITGALAVGWPEGELVTGARASADEHAVPYEPLDAPTLRKRYPSLVVPDDAIGLLEPGAGVLLPEACIESFLGEAAAAGADLRHEEPLLRFRAIGGAVEAITTRATYSAERLLLAAGAWIEALAPSLPLAVERQVLHWFAPSRAGSLAPGALPVFLVQEKGGMLWYGVPDLGTGVKVALHHAGDATTADELDRVVRERDVEPVRRLLRERMPALDRPPSRSVVCMYTNTPDGHFLIDELPGAPGVVVASPCSGHGFKFASVLGELLADRLTGVASHLDLSPFSLARDAIARTRQDQAVS